MIAQPMLKRTALTSTLQPWTRSISTTMTTPSSNQTWPVKQYTPRHQTWPYSASDFRRQDESTDTFFYSDARLVTHIDDAAIATLRSYYDQELPRNTGSKILDFCSSWVSHYPSRLETAASKEQIKVIGLGMNQAELNANKILNAGRILQDLNSDPDIGRAIGITKDSEESVRLDAATNVVSTDYLTSPVEVLRSLREATKTGGRVHLTISNRCFPTKAIGRWLRVDEEERLLMVGDFLHFAGWRKIEIVELSNGKVQEGSGAMEGGGAQSQFHGLMAMMEMGRRDPLWVVRAVKE